MLAKIDYVAEQRGALISIAGDPEPELLADLDGTRVGKTRMRELAERYLEAVNQRLINWTIVAYPNEGWATDRFRRARRRAALGRGRRRDPPRRARPGRGLARRTSRSSSSAPSMLNERGFDSLRFRGPGTDLTVGLIAAHALAARPSRRPSTGRRHVANMPTEEVFTTPGRAPHRGRRPLDEAARASPARSSATSSCASRAAAPSR